MVSRFFRYLARRGMRWLGRRAARRFRRTRWFRRRRRARGQRRSLIQGLNYTIQPFVCRVFNQEVDWYYANQASDVLRFTPYGTGANATTPSHWKAWLKGCDERFVKMTALYKEMQIRRMYIEISLNYPSGLHVAELTGQTDPDLISRTVLVARLTRDCQYNTVIDSKDSILADPGSVISRSRADNVYPRITYTVTPKTRDEWSQWVPTDNVSGSNNITYWQGNHVYFSPAIDVFAYNPQSLTWQGGQALDKRVFSFNVNIRYSIAFRNPRSVTTTVTASSYKTPIQLAVENGVGRTDPSGVASDIAGYLAAGDRAHQDLLDPKGPDGVSSLPVDEFIEIPPEANMDLEVVSQPPAIESFGEKLVRAGKTVGGALLAGAAAYAANRVPKL